MRTTKYIFMEECEYEIELTPEDITLILLEAKDIKDIMRTCNEIAMYFKGLPDSLIDEMPDSDKNALEEFLLEQSRRFAAPKVLPF